MFGSVYIQISIPSIECFDITSKSILAYLFRNLNMLPLSDYDIPIELFEIEHNKRERSTIVEKIKSRLPLIRLNAYDYIDAYKTMVHLEEAAHSKYFAQFTCDKIKLFTNKTDESDSSAFYFWINVSDI